MSRKKFWLASLAFLGALLFTGAASAASCTQQEAEAADMMTDTLDDWGRMDLFLRRYSHCDSGDLSEAVSEQVMRLLVDNWGDSLPLLAKQIKRNPALQGFVLRHVDSTLNTQDLEMLQDLAKNACPPSLKPLCQRLQHAAEQALQDD